jgi:putative nucleotidyltransferase with HDIG domain
MPQAAVMDVQESSETAISSSSFGSRLSYVEASVSLSEVISAMTFALDMTEGAVPGHSLRSCLLGMRLAAAMDISEEMRTSLYYALQLKDTGCSNNAARMTQIVGGDDRAVKNIAKLVDWTKPHSLNLRSLQALWHNILPNGTLLQRLARLVRVGMSQHRNNREMIQLRCERGAEIVRKLEMGDLAADAVRRIDEHWDGSGYPENLVGRDIPLLARICSLAQNLDVFATDSGTQAAMHVIRQRSGKWFDPMLVEMAEDLNTEGTLWTDALVSDGVERTRLAVLELDPGVQTRLNPERVDHICEAFASIVDAKSPFTYRHSIGVADVAVQIAEEMGLARDRVQLVRRAALLHDIGKLFVSNTILDKNGDLTREEWDVILKHPSVTKSILERVSSFRELAVVASEHHEKMDGSGYPLGLKGEQMSIESRLIAVADTFAALAEVRPYREAIEPKKILTMLAPSVPNKFDPECFAALRAVVDRWALEQRMGPWSKKMTGVMPAYKQWPTAVAPV